MLGKQLLWVFLGGGLGASLRFVFTKIFPSSGSFFPWATFTANMLGCFFIGLVSGWLLKHGLLKSETSLFLLTGFCGGLTTFSTLSNESLLLLRQNQLMGLLVYNLSSFGFGIFLVASGYFLAKFYS
ncbi:MAG: fluoride efflux transporter CrcB [Flavobacteriaceae bacterium]